MRMGKEERGTVSGFKQTSGHGAENHSFLGNDVCGVLQVIT